MCRTIKVYLVTEDHDQGGAALHAYGTKDEQKAFVDEWITTEWLRFHSLDDMPDDSWEAYEILKDQGAESCLWTEEAFVAAPLQAELVEALDKLLEQTVDQDLAHGIALTEGEEEARTNALTVLAKARGEG